MQIIITGQHLKKFPELEEYATKKAQKLTRYFPKILKIQVRLISEKSHRGQEDDYYCEIEVDTPGRNLLLKDAERSMDKAIDKAIERMQRLLVKTKEKNISVWHKRGIIRKVKERLF